MSIKLNSAAKPGDGEDAEMDEKNSDNEDGEEQPPKVQARNARGN